MKKTGLLNRELSALVSRLGHLDSICISDAGLGINDSIDVIDLSLKENVPPLLEVLKLIHNNLYIEKILMAEDLKQNCPEMFRQVTSLFKEIEYDLIPHVKFKEKVNICKGVIRTGEFTSYSNVILITGADPDRWVFK